MTLYYIYDALCGWCYGFSPVMQAFYENHRDELDFEVISGGMVTGERVGPIGEVAGYIRQAYKDVEQRTGVEFGKAFLEDIMEPGTAIFSSEPPARALTAFRHFRPAEQVPFAGTLQRAIYYEGMMPEDLEGYADRAEKFGVERGAYLRRLQSEDTSYAVREEFMFTRQLGVEGFPMVVLKNKQEEYYLVARGYVPEEVLEDQYQAALLAAGENKKQAR